jgi:hypothetical protein
MSSVLFGAIVGAASLAPCAAYASEGVHHLPFYARPTHFPGEVRPQAGTSPTLSYGGGPVISEVQIVVVYWGATTSTAKTFAEGFFPAIVDTPYIDQLSEYNTVGQSGGTNQKIVRGSYLKSVAITPTTATGTTIDDSQVGPELVAQIGKNVLPAPVYDAQGYSRTLYFVYFAPGITITLQGSNSCQSGGFCGYHSDTTYNSKALPYAVIPDMGAGSGCDTGCSAAQNAAETDSLGETSSHELSEAITDMDVGDNNTAWYNQTDGEIGDICDTGGSTAKNVGGTGTIGGYTVQYEWSNKNNECELTDPSIGPQGGCSKNTDCTAPTPVCNTPKSTCVQCLANSDCSGSTPICDSTSNTCRACSGSSDCSGSTPVCALGGGDAGTSSDPKAGQCVQCTTNAQCTSSAPVCTGDACTGCKSDSDCSASDPSCNTSTGACGPAATSSGSGGSGSGGSGSGGGASGSGGSGGGISSSGGSISGGEDGGTGAGSGGNGNNGGGNGFGSPGSGGSGGGCTTAAAGVTDSSGPGFLAVVVGLAIAAGRGRRRKGSR